MSLVSFIPLCQWHVLQQRGKRGESLSFHNTCYIFPQSAAEVQSPHFNLLPLLRTHCLPLYICARDDVIIDARVCVRNGMHVALFLFFRLSPPVSQSKKCMYFKAPPLLRLDDDNETPGGKRGRYVISSLSSLFCLCVFFL